MDDKKEWVVSSEDLGCDGAYFSYTEVVRCKDCKYFELDHFENYGGVAIIVAHEICNRWGDGCRTDSNGYCFMGERKTDG